MNKNTNHQIRFLTLGKEMLIFTHGEEWWNNEYNKVVTPFLEELLGYKPGELLKQIEKSKTRVLQAMNDS